MNTRVLPPGFSGFRVVQSLVAFSVVFCRSFPCLLCFSVWQLKCLSFFDLRIYAKWHDNVKSSYKIDIWHFMNFMTSNWNLRGYLIRIPTYMVEVENTSKHICRHPIFYNNNNTRFITQFCSGYTIFLYSVACTEFQRHAYSDKRIFGL